MKARTLLPVALAAGGIAYAVTRARNGRPLFGADTRTDRLDADMRDVLDAFAELGPKPIDTLSPEEARRQPTPADAVKKLMRQRGLSDPLAGVLVEHRTIPGPGGVIPIHIYRPTVKGPLPVLVYFHGGGFVIADTNTYDASPRALAAGAGALVVSVDYRQAPEDKFPAAAEDAFAAYRWVKQHAQEFGGDPRRVAVGGESAGGNLATVVALMARDRQFMLPLHQLLIYPVVDDDFGAPSYKANAHAKPLDKAMMAWFFKHYAGARAARNPYALPMKADTLAGLPPATVITAEIDPLRSEGQRYAERLAREGVPVSSRDFEGVTHEFFGMGAVVAKAKQAEDYACAELRRAFSSLH